MEVHDILRSTKPKTFAQWREFRRLNPWLYWNVSVQNRVAQDIEALGTEAFYAEQDKQ